jgi:hypothetical protein
MSRFYVGQRVRLVRSARGREGKVGRILSFHLEEPATNPGWYSNVSVAWDDGTICGAPSEGYRRCCHTDNLESITDTYDKTSWDECVWKPEHLRTEA